MAYLTSDYGVVSYLIWEIVESFVMSLAYTSSLEWAPNEFCFVGDIQLRVSKVSRSVSSLELVEKQRFIDDFYIFKLKTVFIKNLKKVIGQMKNSHRFIFLLVPLSHSTCLKILRKNYGSVFFKFICYLHRYLLLIFCAVFI